MNKLLLLLAMSCMQMTAAQKKTSAEDKNLSGLDSAFARVLSVWKGPGFAVAVVQKDKVIYAKGFGFRNQEQKLPVTPNTLFAIGSCTKAFTVSLIGILVGKGKLELDKPVRDYFSELKFYNADMNERITLRDMMSHRTGLPRHDYSWYFFTTSSRDSLLKRIQYMEPSAPVREKWQYNNFMFMAQGLLVEKLTGQSWENNVRSSIFEPLGMTRSDFSISDLQKDADAATGYALKDSGKTEKIQKFDYYNIDAMGPAGSINSSVMEMTNWLRTWIHGGKFNGKEIIPASFASDAISSQMIMGSALPDAEFKDIYFSNYGLAWMLDSYRGHYRVEHGGNIDGFSASTCFFPSDSIGIVVLSNQNNSTIPSIVRNLVADKILGLKYIDWNSNLKNRADKARKAENEIGGSITSDPKLHTTLPHALKDYTGLFNNKAYGTMEISLDKDSLYIHMEKKSWWLSHYQYDWFEIFEKNKEGHIDTSNHNLTAEFRTSKEGEINELDLPLEPTLKPLPFIRVPKTAAIAPDSLKRFEGEYLIGNITLVVTLRNDVLHLMVPGQPEYELVPVESNKFSIKSLTGYSVVFNSNEKNEVTEMLAIQPNATYKATRKK
jgi:CubicO group peptidase (beta-lactamase class C family)